MLLWLSLALLAAGIPLLLVDRKAARYFRDHVQPPLLPILVKTTDLAKGIVWIVCIALLYLGTLVTIAFIGEQPNLRWANDVALSLLASFVVGSIALHTVKLFLGRRRPRDVGAPTGHCRAAGRPGHGDR